MPPNGPATNEVLRPALAVLPAALAALAYFDTGSALLWLGAAALAAAGLLGERARLQLADWGVVLALAYEIPSLANSRYAVNGLPYAKVLCCAAACYFLVRLRARTVWRAATVSLLPAAGGVALAWFALAQAGEHITELHAIGLSDVVAFRWRLVAPPAPWVAGEWFTLVLLTLPFALASIAFCWLRGWRALSAVAAVVPLPILAALLLSCSRAVFWAVVVLLVAAVGLAALYKVIAARAALALVAGALCLLGVILFVDNAVYPGIAKAYTGSQTSQVRSTEGRLAIWKRSAEVFRLAPVWGVGSGNAPLFLESSADAEETTGFASRTFSLPIQLLTEKGVIGTGIYLALLVLAGRAAHRKLRSAKTTRESKAMLCCIVAGVIAVLFRELTYSSLLEHAATAMLFATCLALLVNEDPA
ncbi:MAG: O-antigen ligase family protein [Bryobacteraceae bacterium]